MKIIRYEDAQGKIGYACIPADGSPVAIEGDIFHQCRATELRVTIKRILTPVTPVAIIGIAINYRRHAEETGKPLPKYPVYFLKLPGSAQHPGEPIILPRHLRSDKVDYEGELAVVIGRRCKNATEANALDFVLGYTCANDISARDWQFERGGGQFCRGKTFDTFCPLGPALITADEIADPQKLPLRTMLNGQEVQNASTADMIFGVTELIVFLSGSTTLEPGTVILTGTPSGVGHARQPPAYLQPGDTVTVEIPPIGALTNPVIVE